MESLVSVASVVLATALVLRTLNMELVWSDTTPTGGDMGAHVWGPRYLLDHLIPQGRLSGWTPDWYNGFPAYQFYMVVPYLLIVALHVGLAWYGAVAVAMIGTTATAHAYLRPRFHRYRHLILGVAVTSMVLATSLPYNRAFKLVTVAGLVGLPLACWAFAKLADLPFPAPPLAAGASKIRKRTSFHRSLLSWRRTMPTVRWNFLRSIHSSPSSGTSGRPARNQAGARTSRPLRNRSWRPSHSARTPSSFSLTQ